MGQDDISNKCLNGCQSAFPRVNSLRSTKKLPRAASNVNLGRWVTRLMEARRLEIAFAGDSGDPINIEMGLPQGSPLPPILFLLYISDLARLVEEEVEGALCSSCIDDFTRLESGASVTHVTTKHNRCASLCRTWRVPNMFVFESEQTEEICSQHPSPPRSECLTVTVATHSIRYSETAVRCPGHWLNTKLPFNQHRQTWLSRAPQQQAHNIFKYRSPPL